MARPLRVEVAGGIYHVTARGNAGARIYLDDDDRHEYLRLLAGVVRRFEWTCLAYCLMGNHYHLVTRTPHADLSRGMRQLNGVYAQRFHKRHQTYGHLFQSRFHSSLVKDDGHLLAVLRYVARNPVEAGFCDRPAEWPWSSHRAVLGLAEPGFLDVGTILSFCGSSRSRGRDAYRRLVEDESGPLEELPAQGAVLGDDQFALDHLQPLRSGDEVPLHQFRQGRRPLDEILSSANSVDAIAAAYFEHRYRMREIADALGCHYSTISRRLKAWERDRLLHFKT